MLRIKIVATPHPLMPLINLLIPFHIKFAYSYDCLLCVLYSLVNVFVVSTGSTDIEKMYYFTP